MEPASARWLSDSCLTTYWPAYGASLHQHPQDPEYCFSGNRIHPYTYCKPVLPHPLSWPLLQSREPTCVEKDTGTFLKRCALQRHLNVAMPKALLWKFSWGNFPQSFVFEYAKKKKTKKKFSICLTISSYDFLILSNLNKNGHGCGVRQQTACTPVAPRVRWTLLWEWRSGPRLFKWSTLLMFPQASRHLLRLNHVSERAPWARHTCKYISGLNLLSFIGELVITVLSEIGLVFHLVLSILLVRVWRVSLPDFGSVCQALGPYRKAILMGLWNRNLIFLLNSATLGNYDSAYIQTRSVLGMFRIF